MLKTLLKKQMAEIFRNYFYDPKKNKMRSKGATAMYIALYVLLMAGMLGGMFALLAVGICAPMAAAGVGWLYYLVMGLIAVLLGAFGSVFSTYSSLYLSKDNDLLLSMPIPVRYVMASRLLGVYLLGLMYSGVATVPAVIVYWIVAPVTAGTIIGGVLMVLLVSVIVMVLSCLLGWVVARISLKLKNKSFVTVILSLAFLAAYYFVYYKAQGLITLLAENAAVYGAKIRGSAYLLYLFGSVGAGDWLAMLIVTLSQAALLALTLWVIAHSFLKIATATGSVKKVRFEHKAVRAQSVQRALRRKELRRFAASPNYMLNCGLGIVMLPAAGIALLIKGRALAQLLDDAFGAGADIVPVLLSAAVCLLAEPLMSAFVDSSSRETIEVGVQYLRTEGACYIGIGILFMLYGYYRAVNKPVMSVVLTVFSLGTRVLLANLLSAVPEIGVFGIWISIPIGWFLADAVGVGYFIAVERKRLFRNGGGSI